MTITKKPPIHREGKCGHRSGWNLHNRNGEEHCGPCKLHSRTYMAEWRRRTGRISKHLHDPELAAQYWWELFVYSAPDPARKVWPEGAEVEIPFVIVRRFATTPHADLEEK